MALILHYFVEFGSVQAHYVKAVDHAPIYFLRQTCSLKNLLYSDYIIYGERRESPPARALKWSDPLSLAKMWPIISH